MAVSRAPKRTPAATPEIPEDKVQEIIRRGGSVAADLPSSRDQAPDTAEPDALSLTDELKNVQLRLYESTLQEIDQLRRAHPCSGTAAHLPALLAAGSRRREA